MIKLIISWTWYNKMIHEPVTQSINLVLCISSRSLKFSLLSCDLLHLKCSTPVGFTWQTNSCSGTSRCVFVDFYKAVFWSLSWHISSHFETGLTNNNFNALFHIHVMFSQSLLYFMRFWPTNKSCMILLLHLLNIFAYILYSSVFHFAD